MFPHLFLLQSVVVDACVLDNESGLLQQACDITGGIYLKIPQLAGLLQYLMVTAQYKTLIRILAGLLQYLMVTAQYKTLILILAGLLQYLMVTFLPST